MLKITLPRLLLVFLLWLIPRTGIAAEQPNIIFLMLDEWGYFESGHMGHKELLTPNIDQFAKEGMRFTNAFAGAPVCGPTRCCLLTGLHSGHSSMRSNNGYAPIRADEPTIASMLKAKGYATGGFGKWGIGGRGTSGVPETHGFDSFFGYYDQVHAHSYYPEYLIRNSEEVPLEGNVAGNVHHGTTHAQDVIFEESLKFIREKRDAPFFCYLPWTPPHGHWGINEDDPSWQLFKDKPWTAGQRTKNDAKIYAAFMHKVDQQVAEIVSLLKELDIDDNTVFVLCGDNGGQDYFKTEDRPHGFFAPNLNPSNGERFRAGKGSLYEGGLKVPFLVRWPKVIKTGTTSDHLCYFPDMMPTFAEMTEADCPKTDGISILPTLSGRADDQESHPYLYWEYQGQTALRMDDWKGYRRNGKPWELYDLAGDPEENRNVAKENPDVLARIKSAAEKAHEPVRGGEVFDKELTMKDRRQGAAKKRAKLSK